MPTKLAEAEVAVEDEHFYSNVLVNMFDGAARAALTALHSHGDPGGSTIAQQLAKQLYASGAGFGGTLEQVGLGLKLSLSYSKPKILEMYLNAIYYGNGYWGYLNAARGYFRVAPDKLNWAEASCSPGCLRPRPTTTRSYTSASPSSASARCSINWSRITSSRPRRPTTPTEPHCPCALEIALRRLRREVPSSLWHASAKCVLKCLASRTDRVVGRSRSF